MEVKSVCLCVNFLKQRTLMRQICLHLNFITNYLIIDYIVFLLYFSSQIHSSFQAHTTLHSNHEEPLVTEVEELIPLRL